LTNDDAFNNCKGLAVGTTLFRGSKVFGDFSSGFYVSSVDFG